MGVAAAADAPLRFGRCTRCVVKVSGEISDVIPSDAHQMHRCLCWKWEIAKTVDFGKNPDTSWIFVIFRGFERDKPLQTFSTSTTPRVGRSVRFPCHYSRCNIRKTMKNKQNAVEKRIQNQAKLTRNLIFGFTLLGAPPAPAGLVLVTLRFFYGF